MIMVEHDHDKLLEAARRNDSGFELLATDFGIREDLCGRAVKYLNTNIRRIAKEALMGACQGLFCPVRVAVPRKMACCLDESSLLTHFSLHYAYLRRVPRHAWNGLFSS